MKTIIKSIILVLFFSITTFAAKDVNSIIEKNLQARGGKKVLENIKSTETKINMTAMGMEMPMKVFSKKPNKARIEMSVMGQNMITAFDGEKVYMSTNGTITELDGEQAEQVKMQMKSQSNSYDNPLLNYQEKGIKVEYAGSESVEGVDYDILKITDKENKTSKLFINSSTNLDYKLSTKQDMNGESKEIEIFFEDNKKVDGILVPFKMIIRADGEEFASMVFEYIKFNTNIDDKLFKLK